MISSEFKHYLEELICNEGFGSYSIDKVVPVSGGSINETYGLLTKKGQFFLKMNNKHSFPKMFELERNGLTKLKESTSLHVPQTFAIDEFEDYSFLLMEYIRSSTPSYDFWEDFAVGLAELHRSSSGSFGLDENNYNGSLIQVNSKKESWTDFFVENRLMVQEKLAVESGLIDKEISSMLSKLYKKMEEIFPKEDPSLLHGDLWSGNFMVNTNGKASIIDPAIYYGNREMDIAMTHLFGGFDKRFYNTYNEVYSLKEGWLQRIDICNLYPLMVHVNLFGASYAERLRNILKQKVTSFS